MENFVSTMVVILALGHMICTVIVLIKLFQEEGSLHGILGLVCGIYAFIWGWLNYKSQDIKNVMIVWSAIVVIHIILIITLPEAYKTRESIP